MPDRVPVPTSRLEDLVVSRGAKTVRNAPIAVVVMSTNSDPRVFSAIASLECERPEPEICVVNTGTGSLTRSLGDRLASTTLVETAQRQFAGGTRNLGLRFTQAPLVAFLAADCLATPGWIGRRIAGHQTADTVASALLPAAGPNGHIGALAWASCHVTHFARLPATDPAQAVRFGLSYRRSLFDEVGVFDERVRVGEDSLMNERLSRFKTPLWDPEIVTLHNYPRRLVPALGDQYRRGRRAPRRRGRLAMAAGSLKRALMIVREMWRGGASAPGNAFATRCLVLLLAAAWSLGALASRAPRGTDNFR